MYSILTLYNWWSIVNCNRYGSRKYLLIEAHVDEQTSELSGERSWIWCGLVFFVFRLTSSCLALFSYFQCIQYVVSSSSSTAFSLFRFFGFFFWQSSVVVFFLSIYANYIGTVAGNCIILLNTCIQLWQVYTDISEVSKGKAFKFRHVCS